MSRIARILAIAGSDSGGGAGIQADIKTITMLGGHAMTAITAITAQNTQSVDAVEVLSPEIVIAQIDAVTRDIGVDAIKIGMLGSAAIVEAVADRLLQPDMAEVSIVFDPVMIATSGAILADAATRVGFTRILTRAAVTTPNLDELAALSGMPVGDAIAIEDAARHLIETVGACAILATGVRRSGALRSGDGGSRPLDELLFDLLFWAADGWRERDWRAERIETDQDHGTGCTLSSAIATGLGQGMALPDAIERARRYVRATLRAAPGLGGGHGPMGHALGRGWFGSEEGAEF